MSVNTDVQTVFDAEFHIPNLNGSGYRVFQKGWIKHVFKQIKMIIHSYGWRHTKLVNEQSATVFIDNFMKILSRCSNLSPSTGMHASSQETRGQQTSYMFTPEFIPADIHQLPQYSLNCSSVLPLVMHLIYSEVQEASGSTDSCQLYLQAGQPVFNSWQGTVSRLALGPTQPLTQWVLWALSLFRTSLLMTRPLWIQIFLHIRLDMVNKYGHLIYIPQVPFYRDMTKSK
jgi:hypothetical protein